MNTIKLNTIGTPVKKVAGGGASGGGGNYVYYSVDSSLGEGIMEVVIMANIIKVMKDGVLSFEKPASFVALGTPIDTILALGFDKSLKLTNYQKGELVTIEEWVIPFLDQQFPRITEEEFYLKSHFMITNGILNADDSTLPLTFKYDEGMTWREWINSPYNTYGYFIEDQQVIGVFVRKTREGFPESCPIAYSGFDGSVTVTPDEKIEGRGYFIYV